jgi:hypothetical protein
MKKSLALSRSTVAPNEKETSNSSMPNQYTRVKYEVKGRKQSRIIMIRPMSLLMNFLKK